MFYTSFGSQVLKHTIKSVNFQNALRLSIGISGLCSSALIYHHYQDRRVLLSDVSKESLNSVDVDKNVDPLPLSMNLSTRYQLLAHGTRAVTFLKFKVYALGIYVANDDIYKIPMVLNSNYLSQQFIDTDSAKSHSENIFAALHDSKKSGFLISNLLDSNIRLVARITPIRNTDFNHLKDGMVKSILAAKYQDEGLASGLQELKDAFSRKGSVPKNNNLVLERLSNGELVLSYEDLKKHESFELGRVKNPVISKVLFLQYLSGGLSNNTKDTAIEKISQLV
ncbi:hypothetical protein BN7_2106 [Wickerhamomyces ciferrii]|uniref:Altered inheritance of mitochondria protein 18, mitochondrial n=1 Tax=Wickerhamomyces ciferrii (strain ATCC 14091 / BCRC 22168 / CBS 111 / JCM 3599 / NBRC 0793 / NRRL Y-1031 F-60-10) TaxID=1206466 RepID=K0KK63_WICCF|nr:uncharacterized protein BN7_2106 [Wickerhamomyces ciferrii]CCH42562.1 hypothetical protein BN7_2106 [Wickerhamomyces ciferrii]